MNKIKKYLIHKQMVAKMKSNLKKMGYSGIRSSEDGEIKPIEINGIMPDLIGYQFPFMYIFSIETEDTIEKAQTKWTVLSKYAFEKRERFVVVVPEGCFHKAKKQLIELGLHAYEVKEI